MPAAACSARGEMDLWIRLWGAKLFIPYPFPFLPLLLPLSSRLCLSHIYLLLPPFYPLLFPSPFSFSLFSAFSLSGFPFLPTFQLEGLWSASLSFYSGSWLSQAATRSLMLPESWSCIWSAYYGDVLLTSNLTIRTYNYLPSVWKASVALGPL